jgi:hypothetical protein
MAPFFQANIPIWMDHRFKRVRGGLVKNELVKTSGVGSSGGVAGKEILSAASEFGKRLKTIKTCEAAV